MKMGFNISFVNVFKKERKKKEKLSLLRKQVENTHNCMTF